MNLRELLRKEVVVLAAGTLYRGTLVEVSENEVLLKTPTGWVSVQMDRVVQIRGVDEEDGMPTNRFVDPSFYDVDLD